MLNIRSLSSEEEQDIEKLLKTDLTTLYAEFGQEVGTLSPGEEAESQAKKWINARKKQIYDLICVKGNYCDFIAQNESLVTIVGAVSDALASIYGLVPVTTLSTILVRTSLNEMCQCGNMLIRLG